MHVFHITLAATLLFASIGSAQTMKALMFNTTNSTVVGPTNALIFTNEVKMPGVNIGLENVVNNSGSVFNGYSNTSTAVWSAVLGGEENNSSGNYSVVVGGRYNDATNIDSAVLGGSINVAGGEQSVVVGGTENVASGYYSVVVGGRYNDASGNYSVVVGGSTSQASAYSAIALGFQCAATGIHSLAAGYSAFATNNYAFVWNGEETGVFSSTNERSFNIRAPGGMSLDLGTNGIIFRTNASAVATRNNLGLGGTNIVTFAGLTNNGDITINQTATNNGLLYIYRTNSEPFLGLANLLASNNTTVGNETLFRVGVAETTNKAAQFGFRATNTNGTGVAVFSLWGNNALCMIGADASGNAVISSGNPTNEVMTLIVDGATEFARPIRFSTNAASKPSTNAPANTTNVAAWVEFRIGTNSYRAPLYQ